MGSLAVLPGAKQDVPWMTGIHFAPDHDFSCPLVQDPVGSMAVLPGTTKNVPPGDTQRVAAAAEDAQPLRGLKSAKYSSQQWGMENQKRLQMGSEGRVARRTLEHGAALPAGKTFRAPRQEAAAAEAADPAAHPAAAAATAGGAVRSADAASADKPFVPPRIRRLRKAFEAPQHGLQ